MSVKVILELFVKPEFVDQVAAGFKETLVDTRAFEGCEEISVLRNQDDPNKLVILEQWASRESYEAYFKWRTDRGDIEGLAAVCSLPFAVNCFDVVRV